MTNIASILFQQYIIRRNIAISLPIALLIHSYIITLFSTFNPTYLHLINRVTYPAVFNNTIQGFSSISYLLSYILAATVLVVYFSNYQRKFFILFLAVPIPAIVSYALSDFTLVHILSLAIPLLAFSVIAIARKQIAAFRPNYIDVKDVALYFALTALAFQAGALMTWILHPFFPGTMYANQFWIIANLESAFFHTLGIASPIIMILASASFAIVPIFRLFGNHMNKVKTQILTSWNTVHSNNESLLFRHPRALLVLAIFVSVVLSIIPYLPSINPNFVQVGVDTGYYISWIETLKNSGSTQDFMNNLFIVASNGDRPLTIFLFYLLHILLPVELDSLIKLLPVILSPALVLSTYYLVREATRNAALSAFTALITAFSFQILIGIYAAFYANMIAITLVNLCGIFILRIWRNDPRAGYVGLAACLVGLLFAHVYTWTIFVYALVVFLPFTLFYEKRVLHKPVVKRRFVLVTIILLSTVAVDMIRSLPFDYPSGFNRNTTLAENQAGYEEYLRRWGNLNYTFGIYLGGIFTNSIVYLGVLIWLLKIRHDDVFNRLIFSMITIGFIPMLVGNYIIQSRILYNIPFSIPLAFSLYFLLYRNDRIPRPLAEIIIVLVLMILATASIRLTSNLILPT